MVASAAATVRENLIAAGILRQAKSVAPVTVVATLASLPLLQTGEGGACASHYECKDLMFCGEDFTCAYCNECQVMM